MQGKSIVMGPEGSSTPGDILHAPPFTAQTDKFQYRSNVRAWYESVISSAECEDKRAKGITGNLGRNLWARVEPRFKCIIDAALDQGKLRFRNRDGSKLTPAEHIKTIEAMLDIIAKDSVTDRVRRLVNMSKAVYTCRREKGEDFAEYIAKFQSHADAYLSYANAGNSGHDDQNFAMILIENANLDMTTYNNVVKELVHDAKNNEMEPSVNVTKDILRKMEEKAKKVQQLADNVSTTGTSDLQQNIDENVLKALKEASNALAAEFQTMDIRTADDPTRERFLFHITLTKALEALQDIKISNEGLHKTNDLDMHSNSGNDRKKLGTMMGSRRYSNERSSNRRRRYQSSSRRYENSKRFKRPYQNTRYDRSYEQNADSDEEDLPRDEEHPRKMRKQGHVTQRLGNRRDSQNDELKKVQFQDKDEVIGTKPKREYRSNGRSDDESDVDPYFQDQVRPSSRKT